MKWLRGIRRELNPRLNRNTVALLVLSDKVRTLLDIYFEKIMAGSLSMSLIYKEPVASVNFLGEE